MWARVLEVALRCWLLMSPFIFSHPADAVWWATDLTAGAATILLGLLCFWRPLRRLHLLLLGIALWLTVGGFFQGTETPAAIQNQMTVGLLLAMLAIIPTDANEPPESWRSMPHA